GWASKICVLFFFQRVWRVIGGYDVNLVVQHSAEYPVAICSGFDSGIPFDKRAQSFVICVAEPQVMNTSLPSDFLFLRRHIIPEKPCLACRADVKDVKSRSVLFGESDRL